MSWCLRTTASVSCPPEVHSEPKRHLYPLRVLPIVRSFTLLSASSPGLWYGSRNRWPVKTTIDFGPPMAPKTKCAPAPYRQDTSGPLTHTPSQDAPPLPGQHHMILQTLPASGRAWRRGLPQGAGLHHCTELATTPAAKNKPQESAHCGGGLLLHLTKRRPGGFRFVCMIKPNSSQHQAENPEIQREGIRCSPRRERIPTWAAFSATGATGKRDTGKWFEKAAVRCMPLEGRSHEGCRRTRQWVSLAKSAPLRAGSTGGQGELG